MISHWRVLSGRVSLDTSVPGFADVVPNYRAFWRSFLIGRRDILDQMAEVVGAVVKRLALGETNEEDQ